MSSPVKLYLRVRLPDGSYPYLKAAYSSNGRLRPHHAISGGKAIHFPGSSYYLRVSIDGRRIWEAAGSDPSLALVSQQKTEHRLQSVALGLATPADEPAPIKAKGIDLTHAIAEYLSDTAAGKSSRTDRAYSYTLRTFTSVCKRKTLEEVVRRDVLDFIARLRANGNAPRTVSNYVNFLLTFFKRHGVAWPLLQTDRVRYTEKAVLAYNSDEVSQLLAAADQDECDLLQFFLCTGARDREVQFASWADTDYTSKIFSVTEKLDIGFTPKDSEEGPIPIPDSLVVLLRNRRKRYPDSRLIFPGSGGNPNRHFLRTVKRLALKAGLNCGHCLNKSGQCCAVKPVCKRFELHRFRKTFATMHHEAGVPVRTIQRWLRHSDLETTLKYLAASDDKREKTRDQVNATFTFIASRDAQA
jgi:integrase/recombinase XerD